MKIREIMKKDVISVRPQDNAREVLLRLFKMQISGLPVVDDSGKLVGMFTEKSVLSYMLPSYVEKVGKFIYEENPKVIKKKFVELGDMKVEQLMRREVVTTKEGVTLCEVAKDMLTRKARRVPVVDASSKVVGIVCRGDILKALAGEAGLAIE